MNKSTILLGIILLFAQSIYAQKSVTITPESGFQGQNLSVSITGIKTNFGAGSNTLEFFIKGTSTNEIEVSNIAVLSQTTILANLFIQGSATIGFYSYKLNNPIDGTVDGLMQFLVKPNPSSPKLVSVNPNLGHQNQTLKVSITGARTNFTKGSPTVSFFQNGSPTSEIQINSYSLKNDSLLDVNLFIKNTANRGLYTVVFNNNFDYIYKDEAFEITWPLAVEETEDLKSEVSIYPNPVSDELHIESKTALIEKAEIIDLQGRLVQTETPELPTNKIEIKIAVFLVPQQYLIVKIHTNKGVLFQRILIQ